MKNIFTFLLLGTFFLLSCENPESTSTPPKENPSPEKQDTSAPAPQKKSPIDSLSSVLNQDPNNAEAYLARAKKFIEYKNYRTAAADIYNAMLLDSNSAEARNLKGQLNYIQNKSGDAKKEWEKCVSLDPNNIECRMRICELYIAVHDYDKALTLTNEAIKIDPNAHIPYFYKGLIIRDSRRDTASALQYFQKSVDLSPNFEEGLDMMGVTLAAMNDTFAKFYYKRLLDLKPNSDEVYYKLGVFYMNLDEVNLALDNFFQAVKLNPRNAEAYYSIGVIHIQIKQVSQAKDYFTKAIQIQNLNYKAYYGRAYCLEQLGDVRNARNDYRLSLDANPVYTPAKEGLARVTRTINQAK